jgi:secondary thiamine-phosphate synthase enzyme
MNFKTGRLTVPTGGQVSVENVTGEINSVIAELAVDSGICLISTPHTTCGLIVNEDETGLIHDLTRLVEEVLAPLRKAGTFRHDRVDNNAQAHLTSSLLGTSIALPIEGRNLRLGTWQNVFLVECDGPRRRSIDITVVGQ